MYRRALKYAAVVIASSALLLSALEAAPALAAPSDANVPPTRDITIAQLHHALAQHKTTCTRVIQAELNRIAKYDNAGPKINAIITVNPDALAEAEALDNRERSGRPMLPAQCVPVVLKDVINTDDLPTTGGSLLFAHWVPPKDATVTAKLRAAGAIILAKSNLDDFAAAVYGISSIKGAMHNPYSLDRTVGGSSGGSAAAVAAGYAPLAYGTDTGGSLRIPAAFNSVVTIRPTVGLVSRTGVMPRALTQDTVGPIARTVADAAEGLQLIAGYDPADPVTARGDGEVPEKGYVWYAQHGSLKGERIGVVRSGLTLFGKDDPGVVGLLDRAVADLTRLGATVVDVPAPSSQLLGESSVITYESNRDMTAYLQTYGASAPVHSFSQLYASGQYTPYAKQAYDREIQVNPSTLGSNLGYLQALSARTTLQDQTLNLMASQHLDAVVYASAMQTPTQIGVEQGGVFTRWSENTGFPAIAVPMGYTGTPALPASLEFLGRPFAEPELISLAAAYERGTKRRVDPPTTP
jgi:Asp-tRNA(Asn)/Glu-tRNA(Gln) amidotransferase A subunit family amidase